MAEDLDALVRRVDPDRWLSSRFVADAAARADLITLYALDHELTRIPLIVSNPLMGEIRLTWWREGLEEIAEGKPVRSHPVLRAVAGGALPPTALAALAEARLGDLDGPKTGEAALAHADATECLLMALAARRLSDKATADQVKQAARAVALARTDGPLALSALKAARAELKGLPVAAFPAVAHATLAGRYARNKNPGELEKRARILWAVLTGRVG
ncbi:MAG: squalene/phytoene synthase family protein [Caulobacterales bacterium]|nr:squalene/phytoene synthase family protein [Caulobacterales bacterium]